MVRVAAVVGNSVEVAGSSEIIIKYSFIYAFILSNVYLPVVTLGGQQKAG